MYWFIWQCVSKCLVCQISTFSFTGVLVILQSYFNSLWPSDTIWRQRSRSTLFQVMACCLTAPSHYLNQCWLIISEVLWYSHENRFTVKAQEIYPWYEFENYLFKITASSPRGQWVNVVRWVYLSLHLQSILKSVKSKYKCRMIRARYVHLSCTVRLMQYKTRCEKFQSVLNRHHAITWTNDDPEHWYIYLYHQ